MSTSGASPSTCLACNNLQQTENEEELKTTFVVPLSTLKQYKASCPTGGCGVLLEAIECCAPETNGFSQNASVYICRLNLTTHQETNVGVTFTIHDPHSGASQSVELFVKEGSFHPQWPCIMASQSHVNLLSEESIQFVRSCLQACVSNHKPCSVGKTGTFIPKRVLDLGRAEALGNKADSAHLRLVEPGENFRDEPYVALSHRWGDMDTTFTTTLATIRQRQNGIAFDDLSLVYQDAVMLLRRLGIRYLWIDSLCIIQDSAEDWQQESKKMAEVYSNALFTLARQCEDSFPRSISNLEDDTYMIHRGQSGLAVYARPSLLHIWSDIDEGDEEAIGHFPLFSRAWIYQERLLSPRVLHVSNHEFSWICKSLTTCQCRMLRNIKIASRETAYPYNIDEAFLRWFKSSQNSMATSEDYTSIARKWHRIVEEYTALHLTYKSDRLIALQGCATVVEQSTGFHYLKGLWKETLVEDMLWTVHAAANRHVDLLAMPTWSWASVSTQALYQDIKTSYVQVGNSHDEDALVLVGKLLPAHVVNNRNKVSMHAELDREYLMTSDPISYNTWAVMLLFFPDVIMGDKDVFLLRLARVWTNSHLEMEKLERLRGGRWDGEQDFHLVLCEDDGGGSGYHRVGVVVNHDVESDLLDSAPVVIDWENVENKRVVIK